MSKYDTSTVKVFDNEALSQYIEDQLITKLNMSQFSTADNSLAEQPGMVKRIRKYVGNGEGQILAMGEGNTQDLGTEFVDVTYEVQTYQNRYTWYDEQEYDDPMAIESLAQRMVTDFTNKVSKDVVAELGKGTNKMYGVTFNYDAIADANSFFPHESPTPEQLFLLIARKDLAAWKKALKGSLQYVEAFVRTGYIGSIDGVNLYVSDAVPQGKAFLATRDAVTVFIKKGFMLEKERDANTRKNMIYGRKVNLTALTNDDKVVVLLASADPRTGYTVYNEEPATWSTVEYKTAFEYDAVEGKMVALDASAPAPAFVAGKYYHA